jgi:hypothetical protein
MSPRTKLTWALVALLVVLAGVGWWWFHRPAPPYQVQDPGIYPFPVPSADGKTAKWGFIDANGNVLIQPQWDDAGGGKDFDGGMVLGHPVAFNEGLCAVQKDGKWGYIDTSGHLSIPAQFDSAGPFVEGLAMVKLGSQVGFIDKTGQYAINPQFPEAGDFHGGLAAVRIGGSDAANTNPFLGLGILGSAPAGGNWGFINKAGTFVIKPQFQSADPDGFVDGLAGACLNGRCGYIDRTGAFAIKTQFNDASTFSEGMAAFQINGKWGFIDTSGNIVINPQFDAVTPFSGGLAVVSVSGRSGTINKQGKYVVNPGQFDIQLFEGHLSPTDIQPVTSSDGIGLITRDGKWVVKPTKAISEFGNVLGKVFYGKIGGQEGTPVSMSGKVLAGQYKGAMLDTLAQDIQNDNSAIASMRVLIGAEASYSASYAATGFTASIPALGPAATGTPDANHAGYIDADLATGTKDGYQFTVSIPAGTATGGTNFNYFLVAKPAAGHAGRSYCADSSGAIHYAAQGEECTITSPQLGD